MKVMLFPFEKIDHYFKISETKGLPPNWTFISRFFDLPEHFIEEHKDDVDWAYITGCQKLSEHFVRKYMDYMKWNFITNKYMDLSETFIREFRDKIRWNLLDSEKLSKDFIREFANELNRIKE